MSILHEQRMKLADLEHEILPMVPTQTLTSLPDSVQDCRVTLELFRRGTDWLTWAKTQSVDGPTADALEVLLTWARSREQETDWVVAQLNQRRANV
jgi:hypothetical protein